MMRSRFIFVILALLTSADCAAAQVLTMQQRAEILREAQAQFDEAVTVRRERPAKAQEQFLEAAQRFEALIEDGVSNGRLYYNLANAYLLADRLGQAILNYRLAEQFIPGDARLDSNLSYARSLRRNQIETSDQRAIWRTLLSWHYDTSPRGRWAAFLVLSILFWGALIVRQFKWFALWRTVCILLGMLWLAAGLSVFRTATHGHEPTGGVVLRDDVTVRKGNGIGFEPQFEQPLHEGDEFDLQEQRGDWLHITLPNGKDGWIERSAAGLF